MGTLADLTNFSIPMRQNKGEQFRRGVDGAVAAIDAADAKAEEEAKTKKLRDLFAQAQTHDDKGNVTGVDEKKLAALQLGNLDAKTASATLGAVMSGTAKAQDRSAEMERARMLKESKDAQNDRLKQAEAEKIVTRISQAAHNVTGQAGWDAIRMQLDDAKKTYPNITLSLPETFSPESAAALQNLSVSALTRVKEKTTDQSLEAARVNSGARVEAANIGADAKRDAARAAIEAAKIRATAHALSKGEKPPSAAQWAAANYWSMASGAESALDGVKYDPTDTTARGSKYVPQELRSPERQQYEQAADDFVRAVLRKESGAAISEAEKEGEVKKFFPQPGDKPEVVKQKAEARRRKIIALKAEAGPSATSTLAEMQTVPPPGDDGKDIDLTKKPPKYAGQKITHAEAEAIAKNKNVSADDVIKDFTSKGGVLNG